LDNNRLLISIVVVLGILFLYQELLQWRYPNLYGPKSRQSQKAASTTAANPASPMIAPSPAFGSPTAPRSGNEAEITVPSVRSVKIDTDYYEALLTAEGGRLQSFKLKKFKESSQPSSGDYQMIRPGDRLPMGLVITVAGKNFDDQAVIYSTEAPSAVEATPSHPVSVTFTGKTGDGLTIQKTFAFRDGSYVFDVNADVKSAGGVKPDSVGFTMSQPLTALSGYRDYPSLQWYANGKPNSASEKQLRKGPEVISGKITYAGFGGRYFLAALLPRSPEGMLAMDYEGAEADAQLLFPSSSAASQVYMGPKELDVLDSVNPALRKAIDLGFWGFIALPFLQLLKLFYRVAPNYGVAIILLTILVRLLTLPMSIKGQRSMMRMQRLQPQVERIRERFKDQQDKLQHEMMELYKRNHVNPLGGCLPMVIQFPVFIGLYEALLNAVDLRNAPFVGWIRDLAAPDCLPIPGVTVPFTDLHGIPVLVILMALTAFVQQWISPRNPDPSQQKMMMYMPVVFSVIFIELPAGLSLYYFFSNLLGVVQQFILNREFKQYSPVTTT
jgi:YidC/Oxa1 family membrane protein insertase